MKPMRALLAFLLLAVPFVQSVQAMPPIDNSIKPLPHELDAISNGLNQFTRPVRSLGMREIRNRAGDVLPLVVGTRQFPVVAINYPDYPNNYSVAEFQNMLFGTWPSGSARDYYTEVSYGQFNLTGTVAGWYTAIDNRAYYGYWNGFQRAARLAKEAAAAADAVLNYALYDDDGDGYVDAFTCIHAGYGHEETGSGADIHSHAWSFSLAGIGVYVTNDPDPRNGGFIKIDDYTIDPERSDYSNYGSMVCIGVFCHEWGHALGLPDLYDTDGGGQGLGNWSLMAGGSWGGNGNSPWYPAHLDPWCKMELGWLSPRAVRRDGNYTLNQVEYNADAIWTIGSNRTFTEYFLIENRRRTGFDINLPGQGLLIYHIDDSVIVRRRGSNAINNGGAGWKYGVALEQADGLDHLFNGNNRGDGNDPWPGGLNRTTFNDGTNPNTRTNYPLASPLPTGSFVQDIPASGTAMTFRASSGVTGLFAGGPDAAGYTWLDSDDGGPAYAWRSVAAPSLPLGSGNEARFHVTLPYSFRFYGQTYSSMWVSTNGWVSFGADPGVNAPGNVSVPNGAAPNAAIYAFWDDLNLVPTDSGYLYCEHFGTSPNCSTVVTWQNARIVGAPTLNQVTFQLILCENGRIVAQYKDCSVSDTLRNWGRSATVGIENENGTIGLQYLFNGAPIGNLLASQRAVEFRPPLNDVGVLSIDAPVGTVDSGQTYVPQAKVFNYSATAKTYYVRMTIGASYRESTLVTNHPAGTLTNVVLPNWTAGARGSQVVLCTTKLADDNYPANDTLSSTVDVRVADAWSLLIEQPTGTVDSGTVVVPKATVGNRGTVPLTVPVTMTIGSYADTRSVDLGPGAQTSVSFSPWTATERGALSVRCSTAVPGELYPSNDAIGATVNVRVIDAAVVAIDEPVGIYDSGTVVTPRATVRNSSTEPKAFNVTMTIGSFYTNTQFVLLGAEAQTQVSFTPWSAEQRGIHTAQCVASLANDMNRANDTATVVTGVRLTDAAVVAIVEPVGNVDSNTTVVPKARIRNNGTQSGNVTATFTVASYSSTVSTLLAPAEERIVSFTPWLAEDVGSHVARCTVNLAGDERSNNDTASAVVTVRVDANDAAVVSIDAPVGILDSGVMVVPKATVRNSGTNPASFPVILRIGVFYADTQSVALNPAMATQVSFDPWLVRQRGQQIVRCTTALAGDEDNTNDSLSGTVVVRVTDAVLVALDQPNGVYDSGVTVSPRATVRNGGTGAATIPVTLRIGSFYTDTRSITLGPGNQAQVTFADWYAIQRGTHVARCSVGLVGDLCDTNNVRERQVTVRTVDAAVVSIVQPGATCDSGVAVTPQAVVRNNSTNQQTFPVILTIGGVYADTQTVTIGANAQTAVNFDPWLPGGRGTVMVRCSAALAGDWQPANDVRFRQCVVRVTDAAVSLVIAPIDTVEADVYVTPSARVANRGSYATTIPVTMRIGPGYTNTQQVEIGPGEEITVEFASWRARPLGPSAVRCSTALAGDLVRTNDVAGCSVFVRTVDAAVAALGEPTGAYDSGATVIPQAVIANAGTGAAVIPVILTIDSIYADTQHVSLGAGSWSTVNFRPWQAVQIGGHVVTCSVALAGDRQPLNDVRFTECQVVAVGPVGPGWSPARSMPSAPSNRAVKAGGWLASAPGLGRVYAAKGNKTQDFYFFEPQSGRWTECETMPRGTEGKPVSAGAAGTSDNVEYVYALKGNNTDGFWRYSMLTDTWQRLDPIPGPKRVKAGTDLVYAPGPDGFSVYALKGGTNEFWRYSIARSDWETLPAPPAGTRPKWDKGSWLVYDENRFIYAHKGKYRDFYRFDVLTQTWDTVPRQGMPLYSSYTRRNSKAGDGSNAAWYSGRIYALKGSNTTEFWQYLPDVDQWVELETLPQIGVVRSKVKAKSGGDIAATAGDVLVAIKGNNSNDVWQFSLSRVFGSDRRRDGVQASETASDGFRFTIGLSSISSGRLHLTTRPLMQSATLSIYDALGRRVFAQRLEQLGTGPVTLDLRALPAGVYLVKLSGEQLVATQKLVIER